MSHDRVYGRTKAEATRKAKDILRRLHPYALGPGVKFTVDLEFLYSDPPFKVYEIVSVNVKGKPRGGGCR